MPQLNRKQLPRRLRRLLAAEPREADAAILCREEQRSLVGLVAVLRHELAEYHERDRHDVLMHQVVTELREAAEQLAQYHQLQGAYVDRNTGELQHQACKGCPTCEERLPGIARVLEGLVARAQRGGPHA